MTAPKPAEQHEHCWHHSTEPHWITLPDGYIRQVCCECHQYRSIHRDHADD